MNIQQIKEKIAQEAKAQIPTLLMVQQKDEQGTLQPWVSHWDNDSRTRVTMHLDLFKKIAADPTKVGYAYKKELVPATADRAEYMRFVVIEPANVLGTF